MVMTDPVADMLTRIRNATHAKFEEVNIPSSNLKREIARVLKQEGYIRDFEVSDNKKQGILRILLRYDPEGIPLIAGLKRVSTPGCRVYAGKGKIPRVRGGLGLTVLSTSKGILTHKGADEAGVGGEVLCYIW
jgi:small subunit ribosomal protein S8